MDKIAALLLVVGSGCHMVEPKGIWTNCVWISSIFTATLAVLTVDGVWESMRKITILSAAVTMLCIMCGFIGLIKEVKSWPDD